MIRARITGLILALYLLPSLASAQSAGTIIPFITQYFSDANGNPLNGGKLCTYASGTTTPQATYSDVSLMTPNANPVIMSANGRPTTGAIFLSATSYKFELRTAGASPLECTTGTVLWTLDNVSAIPTASGNVDVTGQIAGETLAAGDVVYLSDGSGGLTAGRWYKTDSDNTYSSSLAGAVGIAPAAIASAASGNIRLVGRVTGLAGLAAGTTYYVSATPGVLTSSAPANTRLVGAADTTTSLVLPPDPTRTFGTAGGVLYGTTTSYAASAAGTTGQVLTSGGAGAPTWKGGATLIYANSGTNQTAAATTVDSVAITGLTAKDRLFIIYNMESTTQTTDNPRFYNVTDSVVIAQLNGQNDLTAANGMLVGETTIQQAQSAATRVISRDNGADIASAATGEVASAHDVTFTTAWTGNWTLGLRTDTNGVTAGGTFKWSWIVYRIAGQ